MKFSEKYGYKKISETIQIESMDVALRNTLWSLLCIHVWNKIRRSDYGSYLNSHGNDAIQIYCHRLWLNYFKKPIDTLKNDWDVVLPEIKKYFNNVEWYEVYDFIEFTANNYLNNQFKEPFINACNNTFEREFSAYRFVDGSIAKITNEHEIKEIEQAIDSALGPVQTHLKLALDHLSNRQTPDYRNSIKESISAVEGLAQRITGDNKATLGTLLSKLEKNYDIHPALAKAYGNLYGYTSDDAGIRHALSGKVEITFEDAKYFLVICSAFINYVTAKNMPQ
jgi:hypothetical protein